MRSTMHQGWRNYETFIVKLRLDNDSSSYNYWREAAADEQRAAILCEQVRGGIWTVEEAAKCNLADRLKSEVQPPELDGVWADLLNAALEEVDWQEIAESYLEQQ